MKKVLGLILALAALGLAACGAPAESEAPSASGTAAAESTAPEESAAASGEELLVSAAASMTDALTEIQGLYQEVAPDVTLNFTFGSSGALQTQIEEGAPADVFLSAAQTQMTALEEQGLIEESTKKTLLENKVVLIVPEGNPKGITSFEDVTKAEQIALGEPESVPVGQYSEEIFTSLGILDQVKEKAVYGSDVRAVLAWVETGEVDCGVVYATDAAVGEGIEIICEAPEGSCTPVTYPVAVIKDSEHQEAAKAFVDYLSTEEARAVFEKYGFAMYEE